MEDKVQEGKEGEQAGKPKVEETNKRSSISNDDAAVSKRGATDTTTKGSTSSKRAKSSYGKDGNEYVLEETTRVLTLGAGADVAKKIVDDVQDCLRLDAWKRIEKCTPLMACRELEKLMEANKADEAFTQYVFTKHLQNAEIFWPTIQEDGSILDVILQAMKLHPTNEKMQEVGSRWLSYIGQSRHKEKFPVMVEVMARILENHSSAASTNRVLCVLLQLSTCHVSFIQDCNCPCEANCLKFQSLSIMAETNIIPLCLSLLQEKNGETYQQLAIYCILRLLVRQDPAALKQAIAATPSFDRLLASLEDNYGYDVLADLRECVRMACQLE